MGIVMMAPNRFFFVVLLAAVARPAIAADSGLGIQPIEGWLVGVLVLALITILGRRSSRNNAVRNRSVARSEH